MNKIVCNYPHATGCEIAAIQTAITPRHNLMVIEDAAQGIHATHKGRPFD